MSDVTHILDRVQQGDPRAAEELLPLVYEELRKLAAVRMAAVPPGQTLQATALVHEAYLRLAGSQPQEWNSRGHFFAAAAEAMRRILIERARQKASQKGGGGAHEHRASVLDCGDGAERSHRFGVGSPSDLAFLQQYTYMNPKAATPQTPSPQSKSSHQFEAPLDYAPASWTAVTERSAVTAFGFGYAKIPRPHAPLHRLASSRTYFVTASTYLNLLQLAFMKAMYERQDILLGRFVPKFDNPLLCVPSITHIGRSTGGNVLLEELLSITPVNYAVISLNLYGIGESRGVKLEFLDDRRNCHLLRRVIFEQSRLVNCVLKCVPPQRREGCVHPYIASLTSSGKQAKAFAFLGQVGQAS